MKILGHRHTGIIVQDFDKMLAFYIGLGLELRRRDLEEGPFIDGLLNTKSILLESAKLILENDTTPLQYKFQLELMKIKSDSMEDEELAVKLENFNFVERSLGILDIAFTVDDIQSVLDYIVDQGGDLIGKPLKAAAGFPALHCYARDPEGNVLHLAQNLSAE